MTCIDIGQKLKHCFNYKVVTINNPMNTILAFVSFHDYLCVLACALF